MAEVTIVIKASDQASQPIKNLGKEVDTLKTKVASAGEGFGKLGTTRIKHFECHRSSVENHW